ncbi:glycosyltransferase family 4 protein [Halomontanus rarus]|uniref:glycosyltransferase family 4 protein n=1 Tax=Halomontanus rarus TaxID=3034020 RepID=UPI00307CAD30
MHVAYVTPFYTGQMDGRFGRFHDWVHALRDADDPPFTFEVHAMTATKPDGTLVSRPTELLGDGDDLWASPKNNVAFALNTPRLARDLRRSKADIVHVITVGGILTPTVAAAANAPIVLGPNVGGWFPNRREELWIDGTADSLRLRGKFELRRQLVRASRASHVIAFSEYHREMLELLGIERSRISVLEAGVDSTFSSRSSRRNEPPEVLYVGDLSAHKGYDLFLEAIEMIDESVRGRIVGGNEPDYELLSALDLEHIVTHDGFVDRSELHEIYRSADLLVVPSIDETAGPNTQIEALACGTPVVITDAPGINEYAPAGTAETFWPRTPSALADAISNALTNLEEMTAVARSNADTFDAIHVCESLAEIYENLQ